MRQAALFAVVLCVSLACSSGDDSGDGDDVADSVGTESTDSDGSESTDSDGTESTDTTEDDTTAEGGPWDFPPVVCGDVTCAEGWLCVMPGKYCDIDEQPPVWAQPEPLCASVPPSCVDMQEPQICLWQALCEEMGEHESVDFENGTLYCPAVDRGCF